MAGIYIPPHMRSSAGVNTVFRSPSRGSRCGICNNPTPHECPVSDFSLSRLEKIPVESTHSRSAADYDCFANWHVSPSPDEKVHVKLHIKVDGPMPTFVFVGDNKVKYMGSTKFRPPECPYYVKVLAIDPGSFEGEKLQSAAERVKQSRVYGHSLRTCHTEVVKSANFLLQETRLVEYLKDASRLFREGNVVVRLTKGFVDYHDMDTASAIFLGDKRVLDSLVQDAAANASTTFLICTETIGLLDCADIREVSEVMECIDRIEEDQVGAVDKGIQMDFYLKCALGAMRGRRDDFPTHMLLTISNFDDVIEIGIPGGARNLCDTPLECALKVALKAGIVLDLNSNLTIEGSSEPHGRSDSSVMWTLFSHSQEEINKYYFRAARSGEVTDDATDEDLSEAVAEVSIST
mmetsp:Transcript_2575/g.5221  ORF Transcript_2575/g.5221 Transcript_2575/m.5221 type:complete len:406 (+) Transcript_2575:28-1245(+)|eukprot:CAMPEP_0116921550 /NCGR_PEP_ID=MMETSP0467-20121206/21704_1 /TAXON_ID=283647 /ORGANISM="Mesodinium pulex, Strain SPMC105" /LENGTH=405 /DNA_ID=CAMNT_0004599653 /DNA_START=19 /DNA_END=1236 /DNA_ORIENTATION=-